MLRNEHAVLQRQLLFYRTTEKPREESARVSVEPFGFSIDPSKYLAGNPSGRVHLFYSLHLAPCYMV